MLETIKPSMPVLIEDLGMIYATVNSNRKAHYAIYKCQCGKQYRALTCSVNRGKSMSCGCIVKKNMTTHGLSKHHLYKIFGLMKQRTEDVNFPKYASYGNRGIIICKEWRNDFKSFYDWAMNNGYRKGLSIDRINNDGNYEPSNCRWTTSAIQARNTRCLNSKNTSGYRGVNFKINKWNARIGINNKRIHIGYFKTALEAAKAYDKYVIDNNLEHTINGV